MTGSTIANSPNDYLQAEVIRVRRTTVQFQLNVLQILLVLEGVLWVKTGFELQRVQEGEFIFINAGDVYGLWSEQESCIVEKVSLDIEKLNHSFEALAGIRLRNAPIKGKEFQESKLDEVRKKTFQRYLIEVLLQLHGESMRNENGLNKLMIRIISLALSEYNFLYYVWPDVRYISSRKVERFHRVVRYVKENLSQNIGLNDMARMEWVGKTYFTQMWKEMMDLPFGEYVNYERVLYSERLLLFTDKTMIDISEECGFSDVKYYYKNFKFWYGKKPAEWKKEWAKFQLEGTWEEIMEFSEAKASVHRFYEKYSAHTKMNNRIYEQYLMLKEMESLDEVPQRNRIVSFDLFSPDNLSDEESWGQELPEYSAIDLFIGQVVESGLELQMQIRVEALKARVYSEVLKCMLEKSEQYFGLKEMKNWEFQFVCKSLEELYEAESYGDWLNERLNGGKIRYVLV
ncbi:transcriptional regulator, AraC family [Desulfitobacterium hafniense DP7]|uniref:Transcriptional regulator, AraC family n=1 Tax=Desulfitobacterium hafniense DP7 TaxID=537010 RepID=G9XLW8_DESHA|nr:helix-turn-helix domain-containing protein [Desulfitobacterium hafniense]EHL07394.1 transcriptional regulator, AraC family [Desulfitobacterium hafniense DP7]